MNTIERTPLDATAVRIARSAFNGLLARHMNLVNWKITVVRPGSLRRLKRPISVELVPHQMTPELPADFLTLENATSPLNYRILLEPEDVTEEVPPFCVLEVKVEDKTVFQIFWDEHQHARVYCEQGCWQPEIIGWASDTSRPYDDLIEHHPTTSSEWLSRWIDQQLKRFAAPDAAAETAAEHSQGDGNT